MNLQSLVYTIFIALSRANLPGFLKKIIEIGDQSVAAAVFHYYEINLGIIFPNNDIHYKIGP